MNQQRGFFGIPYVIGTAAKGAFLKLADDRSKRRRQDSLAYGPEFILLDLGLPAMDGYQVARRLRLDGFDNVAVIAISGYGPVADRMRSRRASTTIR
jgi:CheY-like chemotaxis protein